MMVPVQFVLRRRGDPVQRAAYGFDPARGFFVDTSWASLVVSYDISDPGYDGLRGAIRYMADWGYFDSDDVCDALEVVRDPQPERVPGRVRRVLRVLGRLTDAAGM